MILNDMPNEPSQTRAEDDNSFVCPLPRLTDLTQNQCRSSQYTTGYQNFDRKDSLPFSNPEKCVKI